MTVPLPLEIHPWEPFIPENARVLVMGTFPPQPKRWSMDFYYPNRTNDFWYMMGLIFCGRREALLSEDGRNFDLPRIKALLSEKGIALNDTGHIVRRLAGNASDKFLEIVEPVDLAAILRRMPECSDIATTGSKAAEVMAMLTGTAIPAIGQYVDCPPLDLGDGRESKPLRIWRMPSTSRAYPLALEKKAAFYRQLFGV